MYLVEDQGRLYLMCCVSRRAVQVNWDIVVSGGKGCALVTLKLVPECFVTTCGRCLEQEEASACL